MSVLHNVKLSQQTGMDNLVSEIGMFMIKT